LEGCTFVPTVLTSSQAVIDSLYEKDSTDAGLSALQHSTSSSRRRSIGVVDKKNKTEATYHSNHKKSKGIFDDSQYSPGGKNRLKKKLSVRKTTTKSAAKVEVAPAEVVAPPVSPVAVSAKETAVDVKKEATVKKVAPVKKKAPVNIDDILGEREEEASVNKEAPVKKEASVKKEAPVKKEASVLIAKDVVEEKKTKAEDDTGKIHHHKKKKHKKKKKHH